MYIRIEFENIESDETKETKCKLFSIPNGTCLTSTNSCRIYSKEIGDIDRGSVAFWYLDVDILNKHYFGVMSNLNTLAKYPGVSRVDILPIEGHYTSFVGGYEGVCNTIIKYINGV